MELKTVAAWLETLPEPYRTQAIDNMLERRKTELETSLRLAIANAFVWDETPQGYDYWASVAVGGFHFIQGVVNQIDLSVFGQRFKIQVQAVNPSRYSIQVHYNDVCVNTGETNDFVGREWVLNHHPTKDEIVKTCYAAFQAVVIHEVMEGFKYQNDRVFNPHHTISDLQGI